MPNVSRCSAGMPEKVLIDVCLLIASLRSEELGVTDDASNEERRKSEAIIHALCLLRLMN
jgi:hypothetical protein